MIDATFNNGHEREEVREHRHRQRAVCILHLVFPFQQHCTTTACMAFLASSMQADDTQGMHTLQILVQQTGLILAFTRR